MVSSESTRITQINTQTWKIGNPSHFPWHWKVLGSSLWCVSLIILGSFLTSLSLISQIDIILSFSRDSAWIKCFTKLSSNDQTQNLAHYWQVTKCYSLSYFKSIYFSFLFQVSLKENINLIPRNDKTSVFFDTPFFLLQALLICFYTSPTFFFTSCDFLG